MSKSIINYQIKILHVFVIALIFTSCKSFTEVKKESIENFQTFSQNFEKQINKVYKHNDLKGDFIFAIVNEEGLVYSYTNNKESLSHENVINNDSPFYIASHTKSFIGTLLKILEESSNIDLNEPIASFLPELDFKGEIDISKITVTKLLTHTHGISCDLLTWKTAYIGYSGYNSELIENLNNYVVYDPSSNYKYSNIGPIIASMAIDEKMNTSWKQELSANIFQPLEMTNTSTKVSDYNTSLIIPSLITSGNGEIVESGFYKKDITMHASGGIISTVNDLSKWLSANIRRDNKLLSNKSWDALHNLIVIQNKKYFTYDRVGYSLGWDVAKYCDTKILTRFGGFGGISFHISFMPEKKIGVVALSNDSRAYLLPHLMANYAYNKLVLSSAETRFNSENEIFREELENNSSIVYPHRTDLLKPCLENDRMLGIYKTSTELPSIRIFRKERFYYIKIGVLEGKIYKIAGDNYFSFLGPLKIGFKTEKGSVFINGLIYKKIVS